MELTVKLSNRAILRSGQDITGDFWKIAFRNSDLPTDVRKALDVRLVNDTHVCEAVVNGEGSVEPRFTDDGLPHLLCLDGTEVEDLINAVRRDEKEVQECLAEMAVTKS